MSIRTYHCFELPSCTFIFPVCVDHSAHIMSQRWLSLCNATYDCLYVNHANNKHKLCNVNFNCYKVSGFVFKSVHFSLSFSFSPQNSSWFLVSFHSCISLSNKGGFFLSFLFVCLFIYFVCMLLQKKIKKIKTS